VSVFWYYKVLLVKPNHYILSSPFLNFSRLARCGMAARAGPPVNSAVLLAALADATMTVT
jgi:hypothetical protein